MCRSVEKRQKTLHFYQVKKFMDGFYTSTFLHLYSRAMKMHARTLDFQGNFMVSITILIETMMFAIAWPLPHPADV